MMKQITITVSYEEEKLNALKMYLKQKNMQIETELIKAIDVLYLKTIPAGVRDFIEMRSEGLSITASKSHKKRQQESQMMVESESNSPN